MFLIILSDTGTYQIAGDQITLVSNGKTKKYNFSIRQNLLKISILSMTKNKDGSDYFYKILRP